MKEDRALQLVLVLLAFVFTVTMFCVVAERTGMFVPYHPVQANSPISQ